MSFQEVMSPRNFHFLGIKYEEKKLYHLRMRIIYIYIYIYKLKQHMKNKTNVYLMLTKYK
jgi:hypothetical protein